MAITTIDGLIAALPAGQIIGFRKDAVTIKGAGYFHSFWLAGGNPGAASTPGIGAGEAVSSATAGAISFTNPGGGNTLYLGRASLSAVSTGLYMLYDRLVQTSGLVGNTTDAQTVNSAALTRHTTGEGCQAWLEYYTTTGTGTPTCSISYTNQAGTAARTGVTPTWVDTPAVGQMYRFNLQAGDTGIRSVQSVTMSAATGSAGDFGITLLKSIMSFSFVAASSSQIQDAITLGLPAITSDAGLALMVYPPGSISTFSGSLNLIEG